MASNSDKLGEAPHDLHTATLKECECGGGFHRCKCGYPNKCNYCGLCENQCEQRERWTPDWDEYARSVREGGVFRVTCHCPQFKYKCISCEYGLCEGSFMMGKGRVMYSFPAEGLKQGEYRCYNCRLPSDPDPV